MPSQSDFQLFFREKDEIPSISQVKPLKPFIQQYPDESLIANLLELQKNYKYYRAISGDGNCFYRAIMFQYLRVANLHNYEGLFPNANLFICQRLPFGKPSGFTSQNILRYIWQFYLLPLSQRKPEQRQKGLQDMLNSSKNLDAALIGYLRALNYDYLSHHKMDYQSFDDLSNVLSRIKTFGHQSQGVQLYTLAAVLDAQITVLVVHPQRYLQANMSSSNHFSLNFIVSFRPGHYDIPIMNYNSSQIGRYSKGSSSDTPRDSGKSFGSSAVSKFFNKKNEKAATEQRRTFPEVVIVKSPKDLNRVSIKNKDSEPFYSSSVDKIQKIQKKIPLNMFDFRQSRKSNKIDEEKDEKITKQISSQVDNKTLKHEGKVVIPRSSISIQREQVKRQRIKYEAFVCIFFSITLFVALFAL